MARLLNGEIISADSRQFYKHINIGTAKPTAEETGTVKHHLIDFLELEDYFNASMFEKEAIKIINNIYENGKQPIVTGGSGLYIRALVDGIFDEGEINFEIRQKLMDEREKHGNEFMYSKLMKLDPEVAGKMLPQNWKRVIRALEVKLTTGESILTLQKKHERKLDFDFIQFGLRWEREKLYRRIEERVDFMFEAGLVDEVKELFDKGLDDSINSLNTVGYKEIFSYFHGEITLERAKELIKRNTRRYAKRQFTWFNKDERIEWFDIHNEEDFSNIINEIVNRIRREDERKN